jgi:hypothetical protein
MQAAKTRPNLTATAPGSNSVTELLSTVVGFLAIGLLVAGACLPQRTPSGATRSQAALVQPNGAAVARSLPVPMPHSR